MAESLTGGGGSFPSFPKWEKEKNPATAGVVIEVKHDIGQYMSSVATLVCLKRADLGITQTQVQTVWLGTKMLKEAARKLNAGDYITVKYDGKVKGKNGSYDKYTVERSNDAVTEEIRSKAKLFYDNAVEEWRKANPSTGGGNTETTGAAFSAASDDDVPF